MSQLQQLQFPIDKAIFEEVLAGLPPGWTRASLDVKVTHLSAEGASYGIRIDGLGQPGLATVSDELQNRVRELFLLNERFKTDLIGFTYTYTQAPDGRWAFEADYEYS